MIDQEEWNVGRMGVIRNEYRIFVGKSEGMRSLWRPGRN
jgi:hypothetical protein